MKQKLIIAALGGIMLASCADQFDQTFEAARPDKGAAYEYLNDYAPLKEYVADRPDLHLGVGTTVSDYLNQGLVYALTNSNFTETVAGNAMKMASCVSDDGTMDFSTVTDYVNAATDAGLSVYGHTLAWHSQQPNKWLNALIADKPVKSDPSEVRYTSLYTHDFSKDSSYPFYSMMSHQEKIEGGCLVIENTEEGLANWQKQYFVGDQVPVEKGGDYVLRVTMRGTSDGSLNCNMGDWGGTSSCLVNFTSEMQTIECEVAAIPASPCFVVFQSGAFVGTIYIQKVEVLKKESAGTVQIPVTVGSLDFAAGDCLGGWGMDIAPSVVDGICVTGNNAAKNNDWNAQLNYEPGTAFENGQTYYLRLKIKGTTDGQLTASFQNPDGYKGCGNFTSIDVSTDWQEVTVSAKCNGDNALRLLINIGKYAGTLYFAEYEVYYLKEGNSIPLTAEEKKDTLTYAMNTWIGGMMEACQGKVMAWDVVNEALSGADTDGDGWYDLQHASTASASDAASCFYWQDYLGDLDYVRTAVRLAREHFAESGGNAADLKLFVNDYNLESDWDDNRKLKSLIHWIEQWEADGTTRIDGIGSQMHISCYMNETTQASKKEHITKMLELMAATGKLVRISELDMGLVDENGTEVLTVNVTEEQHKAMAALYTWVIKEYFRVVPQAQQWGICQWAPTDSPTGSSWRAGMPIGLWDLDYYRKHTYAGFADGLKRE